MKNISNEAEKDLNILISSFQNDEKVLYKSSINGKISLENGKIYMIILSIIVLVMFFLSLYKSKDANNRLNKGRGFPDPIQLVMTLSAMSAYMQNLILIKEIN